MALMIYNSDSPYSQQRISANGGVFILVFKYNIRDKSWYIDIKTSDGQTSIKDGIKVVANQNLTGQYVLEDFPDGNIWCFRVQNDFNPVSRDNLGDGKTYTLTFLSPEEEEVLGINGFTQL